MYGVQMLKVGESDIPGPELFWMSGWDEWFRLDFQVALVRGNGVCLLVNTGPPEDLTELNDQWAGFLGEKARMRRPDEWLLVRQLERVGVSASEITHVVITPFQLYTTAGIDRFPNATICLSKRGWIHFHTTHEHPHDSRWHSFAPSTLRYIVLDAWDRVRLLEDEDTVADGIRVWWTGAHHRASLAVEVDSSNGTVVISDAFFHLRNVEENHPIGICESIEEALAAHGRARAVADHIVPLYEPKTFEKYPDGVIAEVPA